MSEPEISKGIQTMAAVVSIELVTQVAGTSCNSDDYISLGRHVVSWLIKILFKYVSRISITDAILTNVSKHRLRNSRTSSRTQGRVQKLNVPV